MAITMIGKLYSNCCSMVLVEVRLEARTILRPEMVATVKLWSAAVYQVLRGGR